MAGVEEQEAVGIEDRRARPEARRVPFARELVEAGELFLSFRMVPAEQREVVHQRLRQIPFPTVLGDASGTVTLAQLLAVRPQDHAEMDEPGLIGVQGLVEQALAGRVGEVLLAPDHMRYPHLRVVDHDGEVVRRGAVGLQ